MSYQKIYNRIEWENKPSTKTPLNETNLNKVDLAVDTLDTRVVSLDTTKLDKTTAYTMVKEVAFDDETGVFTITYLNDTTKTIDTNIEKIAVNFDYDSTTQQLILYADTEKTKEIARIDLSDLVTQYEFENTSTVAFEVVEGKVQAKVINGSITADKLQPNFLADVTIQATTAETYGKMSKSYAVGGTGTREGEDTDNAKYYYEQAKEIVGGNFITDPEVKQEGDVLKYDGTKWVAGEGGTGNAIPNPEEKEQGDVLVFDGENWIGGNVSVGTLLTKTLVAGTTTLTFKSSKIKADSLLDYYTSVYGINPINVVAQAGSATLEFEAQAENIEVALVVDVCKASGEPEPEPVEIDITFLVEGAKADNIAIYDSNNNIVGNVIFGAEETIKEVTLTIPEEGGNYTFESSVAKATDGSGGNYSKTVVLNADLSTLDEVATSNPYMTSNSAPYGIAEVETVNQYAPAYYAFDGDASTKYYVDNGSAGGNNTWIQYTFPYAVACDRMTIQASPDGYLATRLVVYGSNDGFVTDTHELLDTPISNVTGGKVFELSLSNTDYYKTYRVVGTMQSGWFQVADIKFYGTYKAVRVMPEHSLYWYGNECESVTGEWKKAPKWSDGEFTKNVNYIRSKATQVAKGIFTNSQAIDFSGYDMLHIVTDVTFNKSGDNGSFEVEIYADSAFNTRLYSNGDVYTSSFAKTLKHIERDISSVNANGFFGLGAYNNSSATSSQTNTADVYAIWLE